MAEIVIDLAKCFRANIFTFLGFILFFLSLIMYGIKALLPLPLTWSEPIYLLAWTGGFIGLSFAAMAAFGLQTYVTYRRAKKVIRERGVNNIERIINPYNYCSFVGFRLALTEAKKRK